MVGKQLIENVIKQIGTKLKSDYVHKQTGKDLSTNDLTNELLSKINNTNNYDDTEIRNIINTKANISDTYNKTTTDNLLNNKVDKEAGKSLISQIDLAQINTNKNNILLRSLITQTGAQIQLTIDNNYSLGAILKDKEGNTIYVSNNINLPLNNLIKNVNYENNSKEIVITYLNNNIIRVSIEDLINGLVSNTQLTNILSDYYNKANTDNLLNNKANKIDVYTKTEVNNLLNDKVDKVTGKSLSTNDFTNEYKSKVDNIADMSTTEVDELINEVFEEVQ